MLHRVSDDGKQDQTHERFAQVRLGYVCDGILSFRGRKTHAGHTRVGVAEKTSNHRTNNTPAACRGRHDNRTAGTPLYTPLYLIHTC